MQKDAEPAKYRLTLHLLPADSGGGKTKNDSQK